MRPPDRVEPTRDVKAMNGTGRGDPERDTLALLQDPDLAGLARYWFRLWRAHGVPARRRLDPAQFPRLLPQVWLVERVARDSGDGPAFRYRLAGESINEHHGFNLRGRHLHEIAAASQIAATHRRFQRALDGPAIAYNRGPIYAEQGRFFPGERLILPIGGDADDDPQLLLGATVWQTSLHGLPGASWEQIEEHFVPLAG
jgi:hypothetical protein